MQTYSHTEFAVQYLAQGHFDMQTGGLLIRRSYRLYLDGPFELQQLILGNVSFWGLGKNYSVYAQSSCVNSPKMITINWLNPLPNSSWNNGLKAKLYLTIKKQDLVLNSTKQSKHTVIM